MKHNLIEKTHLKEGEVVSKVNNEYDIGNRLIRSNDKEFSYDNNGNQITSAIAFDGYSYLSTYLNGQKVNMLTSIGELGGPIDPGIQSAGGSSVSSTDPVVSYGYALDGRRIGKSGDVDVRYLYIYRKTESFPSISRTSSG